MTPHRKAFLALAFGSMIPTEAATCSWRVPIQAYYGAGTAGKPTTFLCGTGCSQKSFQVEHATSSIEYSFFQTGKGGSADAFMSGTFGHYGTIVWGDALSLKIV